MDSIRFLSLFKQLLILYISHELFMCTCTSISFNTLWMNEQVFNKWMFSVFTSLLSSITKTKPLNCEMFLNQDTVHMVLFFNIINNYLNCRFVRLFQINYLTVTVFWRFWEQLWEFFKTVLDSSIDPWLWLMSYSSVQGSSNLLTLATITKFRIHG